MNYLGFLLQTTDIECALVGHIGETLDVMTETAVFEDQGYAWAIRLVDRESGIIRLSDWQAGYTCREDARAVGVDLNQKAILPWSQAHGSA